MKSKETKPAEVSTSSVPNFSREEIHAVVGMPHAQSMAVPAAPATAAPNLLGMISWHRQRRLPRKHPQTLVLSAQRRRATAMAGWVR